MKQVPERLITEAVQCIRSANHPNIPHNSVEAVARQLEGIRDNGEEYAQELAEAYRQQQEDESGDKEDVTPEDDE